MRFLKTMLVMVIMSLFAWLSVPTANAGNYIGDYCWRIECDNETAIMQVAVTDMGNGHYFLNGRLTFEGEGMIAPAHGNAELIDNKVYMTVQVASRETDGMWANTAHIVLDLPSLNGTTEIVGIFYEYDPQASQSIELEHLGPWTMSYIPCP